MREDIQRLREALLDITGFLNRPQPDAALIARASVNLDRALFPLLVRVESRGPIAIGELAELCGRDYTTVSRQVTKLESLGLVIRRPSERDARIKEAAITAKGRVMITKLDGAREQLMTEVLAGWRKGEVAELARLLRRLADDGVKFVRAQRLRVE